jgi:uncharacterized protein involved in exopolysaccharide biosynthesis
MSTQAKDAHGERRRMMLVVDEHDLDREEEDNETKLDLMPVLLRVLENKRQVLYMAAAGILLGLCVAFALPKEYTGTVKLLPPQQTPSSSMLLANQLSASGLSGLGLQKSIGLKDPNEMYIGMLKSRTPADALIKQFRLVNAYHSRDYTAARRTLENNTDIKSDKDGLFVISVVDKDRQRAADLANAYVEQLRALSQEMATTEASKRRLYYEQQLKQAKDDLASAETNLALTQANKGVLQPEVQARDEIQSLATLRAQATIKQEELAALRARYTDNNIAVKSIQRQLESLEKQINRMPQQSNSANAFELGMKQVPLAALEYLRGTREVKFRETVFELFLKQYEAATIDESQNAVVIQVVEAATPPERKSSPNRPLIVLGATLAGLFAGMILAARHSEPEADVNTVRDEQHLRIRQALCTW